MVALMKSVSTLERIDMEVPSMFGYQIGTVIAFLLFSILPLVMGDYTLASLVTTPNGWLARF
jgi:hypothetical protein